MSVYSQRLASGTFSTAGGVIFTAPSQMTTIVRDIEVWTGSVAVTSLSIELFTSGSLAAPIWVQDPTATTTHYQWTGRVVLNATDELYQLATGAGGSYYLISGYVLN